MSNLEMPSEAELEIIAILQLKLAEEVQADERQASLDSRLRWSLICEEENTWLRVQVEFVGPHDPEIDMPREYAIWRANPSEVFRVRYGAVVE